MRKQWQPRILVQIGDDQHEFKTFMASEMAKIAELTGGEVTDRTALIGFLASEDHTAWRAVAWLIRKRQGATPNFDEIDVDLTSAEVWAVDESGREVTMHVVAKPCPKHLRSLRDDCDDCGRRTGPETDKNGEICWFFEDDDTPVPTVRVRRDFSTPPSD